EGRAADFDATGALSTALISAFISTHSSELGSGSAGSAGGFADSGSGARAGVCTGGGGAGACLPLRTGRHPPPGAEPLDAQWRNKFSAASASACPRPQAASPGCSCSGRQPLIAPAPPPPAQT